MRVAVIGAGIVGLATTAAVLDFGGQVTCYEAVGPMSQRSAGPSRIFRLAHGQPELVELAAEARRGFRAWEALAGSRLVDRVGAVFCGGDIAEWVEAMSAVGERADVFDPTVAGRDLPVRYLAAPAIVDPEAGVIDARRTGEVLVHRAGSSLVRDTVRALELTASGVRVKTDDGWRSYDAGILAAGSQTAALAKQIGIEAPSASAHHVRFTFALDNPAARPPCLIDRSESWRTGFTTYQHLAAPGRWAVGAHLPHSLTSWERGRSAVVETSRKLTVEYVRECLRGVSDDPLEELYCDIVDGWGDGYGVKRNGALLVPYGDNLFKFAPALGRILAEAALSGATPRSVGLGAKV